MKLLFKQKMLILCLSTVFGLGGCNNDDTSVDIPSTNDEAISHNLGSFVSERPYILDSLDSASSMRVMDYTMPNIHGETIKTSAFVFFPQNTKT